MYSDISLNLPQSEILTSDELAAITGCAWRKQRIEWLDKNGWQYVLNRAGEPIVSRYYARCKMSGIKPGSHKVQQGWQPDFAAI